MRTFEASGGDDALGNHAHVKNNAAGDGLVNGDATEFFGDPFCGEARRSIRTDEIVLELGNTLIVECLGARKVAFMWYTDASVIGGEHHRDTSGAAGEVVEARARPGNAMRFPSHGLHASSITWTQGSYIKLKQLKMQHLRSLS
jgi:hypothetical protein